MTTAAPSQAEVPIDDERDLSVRWTNLAAVAIAVLSAGLLLVITRITHPGVGTDAVCYIAVADRLAGGHGLGFFLEDPLVTWPPLWPGVLAVGRWIFDWRGDVVAVAVNALLLLAQTFILFRILGRVVRRRWLVIVGLVALMLGPSVLGLAAFVQSETIFNVFVLGTMLALLHFEDERRKGWIALAVVLTWGGFLCRYPGTYTIPVFAAWLVLPREPGVKPWNLRRWRWSTGLLYALPAAVVPLAWIARNLHVSSTSLGPRYASGIGLPGNANDALVGLARFLLTIKTLPDKPTALAMVIFLGLVTWLAWRAFFTGDDHSPLVDRLMQLVVSPVGLFASFGIGYTLILVVSRSLYGFDVLDIRLMAPALLAFAVFMIVVIERSCLDRSDVVARVGRTVFFAWCVLQLVLTLLLVGPMNDIVSDVGYNAPRARAVATSPVLDEIPSTCTTYSNNPFDLYREGYEFQLSPRRLQYQSSETTTELPDLQRKVDDGLEACLVWIDYTDDDTFWSLHALGEAFDLVPIGRDGDLRAFRIEPR